MSKFLARFGGSARKKENQSPNGHKRSASAAASSSSNGAPSSSSSPGIARRASKQLLNFSLSSPGNGGERPAVRREISSSSALSAAPKIELDFGGGYMNAGSSNGEGLQSTGVGLQSPITGVFDASQTSSADSANGNGQPSKAISKGEVELLRKTRYTWTQVEKAWAIAGEELKVIGLKTPDLFLEVEDRSSDSASSTQRVDETNRLLAIFTISTSPSPPALLPSFQSLSDYYPPVSFIPQTEEWYENDFKTNVGWVKDPRVLVRFLKTVTRQVSHDQRKPLAADVILPEWYNRFKILERNSSYPTDAFSRILSPLISTEQYDALSKIFDIGAVITANAATNGCLAREVLCGSLGWWIVGSSMSDAGSRGRMAKDGSGEEGWTKVYRAWEEARDAMYHLFKAWIRDEGRTGTLPLLVLEHVQDYRTQLESSGSEEPVDIVTVLECGLSYQLPANASSSTYSPTTEDLVEGMLLALESVGEKTSSEVPTSARWERSNTPKDHGVQTTQNETPLLHVVQAIREAQYPHVRTAQDRPAPVALPQTPNAKDGASIYRPFRTPSSSSFMHENGTPNGQSSPGVDATPPRTPFSPVSAVTTPGVDVRDSGAHTRDAANWTDFAETGFGETTAVPKPFVLGDAFKELKIREEKGDRSTPQSRGVPQLGLGRPRGGPRSNKAYTGIYNLKKYGTTSVGRAFIEFEHDARLLGITQLWSRFEILHLDVGAVHRLNLQARHLLVSVKLVIPEPPKQEAPPTPIETEQLPVSLPLQTPPVLSNTPRTPQGSTVPDSEKRNRRRSFFRSFSGSSSKNRKVSSPSISSPLESPLPAVAEKREPIPTVQVAQEPELPNTPRMIQAQQPSKLSPMAASNPTTTRSRSSSNVSRKPVPALEETDLQGLSLSEAKGPIGAEIPVSANEGRQSSATPTGASDQLADGSLRTTSDVDVEEYQEVIETDSPRTSLSVTDTSEVAKSPHRRRRSGAPSPASVGFVNGDHAETSELAERLDGFNLEENEDTAAAPAVSTNAPPAAPSEKPGDTASENTVTHDGLPISGPNHGSPEPKAVIETQPEDSIKAPVSLGAIL